DRNVTGVQTCALPIYHLVRSFVFLSCLKTKCWLAPRCARTRTSDSSLAFTTTVRMVIRVHNRTTNSRSDTHVTFPSCFTNVDQVVVSISYNSDGSAALAKYHSHFSGWKS